MKSRKKAYTLVELGASLGIVGVMSLVGAQESQFESTQVKARALGNEIFLYNAGVSRFLAANAGDSSVAGLKVGSDWLKSSSDCSLGAATESYLGCDLMPDGKTVQYGLSPATTITYSSDGDLSARTVWDTIIGRGGESDSLAMGVAALVSSGNYITHHNDAASGYQSPTVYCPDIAALSASISATCGVDRDVIISTSGLTSSVEPWLRTDHGNTMRHTIEFDSSGVRSTETELKSEEDRSSDSWLRQIVNVSRIYNGKTSSGDSLTLGAKDGQAIYSDSLLTSKNLLTGAIIMDGDAAVMGDIYSKGMVMAGDYQGAGGTASLQSGDIVAENDVRALEDVVAESNIRALEDVEVGDYLKFNSTRSLGAACSPVGIVSRASDGTMMNCRGGRWRKAGSTPGMYAYFRSYSCPPGWTEATSLRGKFIRSYGGSSGAIGATQGESLKSHGHTGSTNSAGNHKHTGRTNSAGGHRHGRKGHGFGGGNRKGSSGGDVIWGAGNDTYSSYEGVHSHTLSNMSYSGSHSHTVSINPTGGSETRPTNVALLACVQL